MQIRPALPRRHSHPRPRPRPDIVIGRGSDCDVVLDSWTVSRHHACIRKEAGLWILEDLDSTNGSAVNGDPVIAPVALHDGDFLTFGIVSMRFTPPPEDAVQRV